MARPGGNPNLPPFKKDDRRINRGGRPPGQLPAKAIVWDLKMAARSYCKEALDFIVETMRDKNESRDTRLKAAGMLLERGYGRPLVEAEIDVNHNFVIAPQTMELEEWLANKGQPTNNAWLQAQRGKAGGLAEERTSAAPAQTAGHRTEEDALLTAEDPTAPAPPGSKLN
jgi:hypothetical protein